MQQNAQCYETPNDTKRSMTKRPMLQNAQNPKKKNPKNAQIRKKSQKYT